MDIIRNHFPWLYIWNRRCGSQNGSYDRLLEKFGKTSASIGFAIVIDELMNALIRQKIRIVYTRKNAIILYDESRARDAIRLAKDFRAKAKRTQN